MKRLKSIRSRAFAVALTAACVLVSGTVFADAADDADVMSIKSATHVMKKCAKMMSEISTVKVPKDHAKARHSKAIESAPIDADNSAFMDAMEKNIKRLTECGIEFQEAVKAGEAAAQGAGKRNKGNKQARAAADFAKYQEAKEELVAAVIALTQDPTVSSYVTETLQTYYFK